MINIEINDGIKPSEIDENFVGLCVDCDGDIWLFGENEAVCLSTGVARFGALLFLSKEDAFQNSPFTKFNGSVTLENDGDDGDED